MLETDPLVVDKSSNRSHGSFICVVVICAVVVILFFFGTQQITDKHPNLLITSDTIRDDAQRILIYYSPNEEEANNVDLIELIDEDNLNPLTNTPYITHIEIGTLHLKQYDDNNYIHLNDLNPDDSRFIKLRQTIPKLQAYGVKVMFMIGGWEGISGKAPHSDSSFVNLFTEWSTFYPKLVKLIKLWNIDGLDIDIENCYDDDYKLIHDNYNNVIKLIRNLRSDLGDSLDFIIALSPVAEAIFTDDAYGGLSGFNYKALMLESKYGSMVNQLNVQFYDGWGSLLNIKEYEQCIQVQGYKPNILVAGMLNADKEDISDAVQFTLKRLTKKYGDTFGGVAVYYGNVPHIVKWSKNMYNLLHS